MRGRIIAEHGRDNMPIPQKLIAVNQCRKPLVDAVNTNERCSVIRSQLGYPSVNATIFRYYIGYSMLVGTFSRESMPGGAGTLCYATRCC
nr:hypothetical protein Q903MT_gene960 [Picea sitchensis]